MSIAFHWTSGTGIIFIFCWLAGWLRSFAHLDVDRLLGSQVIFATAKLLHPHDQPPFGTTTTLDPSGEEAHRDAGQAHQLQDQRQRQAWLAGEEAELARAARGASQFQSLIKKKTSGISGADSYRFSSPG